MIVCVAKGISTGTAGSTVLPMEEKESQWVKQGIKLTLCFKRQPGPQEPFLVAAADIVLYGGAAGSGKTFAMILETLRHVTKNAEFSAVIFRRSTTQVRNPGGLWDESLKLVSVLWRKSSSHLLEWRWKKGGKVKMAHLEHGSTVLDWQGGPRFP